jgi:hypothetical protein
VVRRAIAHALRRFTDFARMLVDARLPAEAVWRVAFHANQPCSIQPSFEPGTRKAQARWPSRVCTT